MTSILVHAPLSHPQYWFLTDGNAPPKDAEFQCTTALSLTIEHAGLPVFSATCETTI